MTTIRSDKDGHWSEFLKFAVEAGISLNHPDDWTPWWTCWNAALDAEDNAYLENIGQERMDTVDDDFFDDIPF
jgi:hypothetical protein